MGLNQYKIVLVNLDPTVGSEIQKTRPCVIVSPDEMNRHLRTVIIVPITSKSKDYPSRLRIDLQGNPSWLAIDQIRVIDKTRVVRTISQLKDNEVAELKSIIREALVD